MATLKMDQVKKMGLEELNTVINTNKALTPVMKQAIQTRIKTLTPVEAVQEIIAQDAVTAPIENVPEISTPDVVVLEAKVPKNKPNETTRTIIAFTDDTKGIRAGSMVTFLENNKPGAKLLTGKVFRVFDFYGLRSNRQEVKIMVTGTDGKTQTRYYRFEKDITPMVTTPAEPIVPEVIEGLGI